MAIPFPDINPIAITLGPFSIHWYGLSYMVSAILVVRYSKFLLRRFPNGLDGLLLERFVYGSFVIGVIVGGRLGHVLFYDPLHYVSHPIEIFMVWEGGMSFHGGLIGVLLAAGWFCKKHDKGYFQLLDNLAVAIPIGLFLGRIANFINGELYGKPTNLPFGVIFPRTEGLPRHPTQIYEAFFEGFFLLTLLSILWMRTDLRQYQGRISGLFLISYAASRFFIEFLKDPLAQSSQVILPLNNGQLLCIPMILLGVYLWRRTINTKVI
ncbi:MAG: prolipoprotein diacylglyceryl transferase [Alphaproteobacteria bacterium]|nr:prolipoprotein diacylglyceryl transferase [Alphaproteobacteria bacterium]